VSPNVADTAPDCAPLDVFGCPLAGISLVEASAGTGKTWNICALYLRLLLERRLEVQQILVVTFTNAATAELRERIRARIVDALDHLRGSAAASGDRFAADLLDAAERNAGLSADAAASLLESALQHFDEASIFTIHGFCRRALADTPFSARLPFDLELIEDDAQLRLQAAADFWRRRVAGAALSPELAALLMRSADSPQSWARLLGRLQAKPLARVRWPDDPEDGGEPPLDALADAFASARRLWDSTGPAACTLVLENLTALNANSYKADAVREAADGWAAFFDGGDPLASPSRGADRMKLLDAGHLAARTKKKFVTPDHPFFDAAASLLALREQCLERLGRQRLRLLRRLAEEAGPGLRRVKRERRVAAFDDILYNAYEALHAGAPSSLAGSVRRRFPAALIDEFQDTDPVQFAIFDAIYGNVGAHGGPLFLVGDPKQAIYSFRNADLHTYLQAKSRAGACRTLTHNQRSDAGLIEALNRIFAANDAAFILPGIGYQRVRAGTKPRKAFVDLGDPAGSAAGLRLWRLPVGPQGDYLMRAEAMVRAARATAAEAARLVREGAAGQITLDRRGLRAGDIAILVRSHAQGGLVKRALAAFGIGSVELSRESVFASTDAEEMERLLLAILEPGRPALLLGAFATELLGLDAAALLEFSRDHKRLEQAAARFGTYRDLWLARGFGFMFRQARPDGERRLTNLLHLGELLHQAAATCPAPDALVRWLADRRAEDEPAEESQLRLESDRNLAQIATIHKSKGLEFPVVFCPFLWDGESALRGGGDAREYHDPDGTAVIDFRPESAQDEAVKARRREEADAESIRLAYVALTRAAHRCYLVAGCYLAKKGAGAPSVTQSTRSLLNWLVAGNGRTHAQWLADTPDPSLIEAAWRRIAEAAAPHAALADLPEPAESGQSEPAHEPETLRALEAPAHIPAAWRIGSYSSLHYGAEHEGATADHDARARTSAQSAPDDAVDAADILRFPRGPAAGDCLHALFERIDFTDPSGWNAAVARTLDEHPMRLPGMTVEAARTLLHRMLSCMLGELLSTTLPHGIVLKGMSRGQRLTEIGFHLPAAGFTAEQLNDWLRVHGYPTPRLGFGALRGYLRGYIDLVFRHAGRWYVLDWKSNYLGDTPADYAGDKLSGAMQAHGYHLQALIYAVALNRYLSRRVPDYEFERDFGGILYLFVRAVRPGWADRTGAPAGVWFHRPARGTIASLDELLAGPLPAFAP
jgi:exodeoxyribonuclease V beta subunit